MTEDEAKTKWCPMYRISDSDESWDCNRDATFDRDGFCLGSDCAVWRWHSIPQPGSIATKRFGHCGLASKIG